jgi:hypothetical protein
MTPKEKASNLVYKYQYLVNTWDCYNDETLEIEYRLPNMKLCALIAIDLAIECNDFHINYLEEVKQEIEKL